MIFFTLGTERFPFKRLIHAAEESAAGAFPEPVVAGIRVAHIGLSSVRYEVALFPGDEERSCAAQGHFVHVYVDRDTRRPAALPAQLLAVLETLK